MIFFFQAARASEKTNILANYLLESTLIHSCFVTKKASFIAASCFHLAVMTSCGEWTPTLVYYSGYTNDELRDCVPQLNSINCAPPDKNLMAVQNKELFHKVAKTSPLDTVGLSDAYYSA